MNETKRRSTRIAAFSLALVLLMTQAFSTVARPTQNQDMTDSAGNSITAADLSGLGEFSAVDSGQSIAPAAHAPNILARQDYQNVYEQALALYQIGHSFRAVDLQLPPSCSSVDLSECRRSYEDFNSGRFYYRFCTDYAAPDLNGYCREWETLSEAEQRSLIPDISPELPIGGEVDIRNKLIRAREMYGFLSLAEPADLEIQIDGAPRSMRAIGRSGVLSATREIARVHMIFGNEFMVDALDYRFGGSDPRAEQIINEEISQLEQALEQYGLAVETLAHAFNADFGGPGGVRIGDYFGALEFDLFGTVSERMVVAISEIADRYRQLGQDEKALQLYAEAFANQYVQAIALAVSASQQNANFIEHGGWEILTNLEGLRARAQAIHDGINPFGYVDEYVPLQTYTELRDKTRNTYLRDSTEDEATAAGAAREFDRNRTALDQELQGLRLTYDNQLLELCGATSDDYKSCDEEGGLMRQNYHAVVAAVLRIGQVRKRLENIGRQMEIEEERSGRVISITIANGEEMALLEYEKGVISSYRVTEQVVESQSDETYYGTDARAITRATASWSCCGLGDAWFGSGGFEAIAEASVSTGYKHSSATVSSIATTWDPSAEQLGAINSVQALQNAITQAEITNANSEAVIKNLMLQQSELLIELNIAFAEYNRIVDEHQRLKERYHNFYNLRAQAQQNVAESYLTNPVYRILRDHTALEAARSHIIAAQFAYLTAKALEYEYLKPYPGINDIFKARIADDIDNFLNDLETFDTGITQPRDRYPYEISLAKDLLGLSNENLDPDDALSQSELRSARLLGFQDVIQANLIVDETSGEVTGFEIPFTTSLLDNRIFTPNIWNNRISGVNLPTDVSGTRGVSVNLLTSQFGDIGTPEILLTHDGDTSYRTATGQIIRYVPENAKLAGYPIPGEFESRTRTALIQASVNGNGQGSNSSALFNRSVAASRWTLRVDLRSPFNANLDVTQIEDIEINMDTTGFALPGNVQAAQADALRLQAQEEN